MKARFGFTFTLLALPLLVACSKAEPPPPGSLAVALSSSASAAPSGAAATVVAARPARPAPSVGLDGQLSRVAPAPGRRIFARSLRSWIYERPSRSAERLGYFRAGASLSLRGERAAVEGCAAGWYPVEPRGFVCAEGEATLDENDAVVAAYRDLGADLGSKLPYIYGTVRRPGPIYTRLPTRDEAAKAEGDLDQRMASWLSADGEVGAGYAQQVWLRGQAPPDARAAWDGKQSDVLPAFLSAGRPLPTPSGQVNHGPELLAARMKAKQGLSLLKTVLFEGRRYGVTSDLDVVPTDRLRPIQGSEHHGVEIGKGLDFPFALVRSETAKLKRYEKGKLVDAGPAEYWAVLKLTGKQSFFQRRLYFETSDGTYISDQDASRLDQAKKMPAWGKNGERWLDVNVSKQTLVAYEGTRAVYATLISTGEAGLEDPEHTKATKRGIFRIHTKHVSTTMDSDAVGEEFELRDVPYVQYFEEGYALHGAYWHDRFGTPKSHGCINLTPEDARRLFFFTQPALPEGWHSVLQRLTGTVLFVHP
ncbi:MAG TPA: L,D-transpeptidase [Polyangiaceae bacterium]|nr:L,D-transpeptidase [Polyangiaceae bacterium]